MIGAGIYALPSALALASGPYSPLILLVCGAAIGTVAICFAEGGSRIATSGGATGYIEAALGPLAGYIAGMLLWFGNAVGMASVLAALAAMITPLLPDASRMIGRIVIIVGAISVMALINVSGAARMARFVSAAALLKLVPIAAFLVAGASAAQMSNFAAIPIADTNDLGRGLILGLFAYTGMEGTLGVSGEVKDPARNIPRALAISLSLIAAVYVAIQFIAQGILGPSIVTSAAPLVDAMARLSPALRIVMLVGAALSMFGILGSDNLGTPRVLFAFARHGYLPAALGLVHRRWHTPYVAIACYTVIQIALALTGTFAELAILSTLMSIAIYIAGCAAAWLLSRRNVAMNGAPLNFPYLGVAAALGIVSMSVIMVLASRAELLGLAASILVSAALYFAVRRRSLAAR